MPNGRGRLRHVHRAPQRGRPTTDQTIAQETDREAVLARFVSALSESDENLLRRVLAEGG
jgi:hypothetical protein